MNQKVENLLLGLKDKKVGVFCDDSNLYHAYEKCGWRIDFKKLRKFLEQYCDLRFINYHIAIPAKSDVNYKGTESFIRHIADYLTLKKKMLKYIQIANHYSKKGDVDVEIVLDVVRLINNLDAVIIMSGDSDYLELKNYVVQDKGKSIIFMASKKVMGWELRTCRYIFLERIREFVELKV